MTATVPVLLAVGIWFIVMDIAAMNTRSLYPARKLTRKLAYGGIGLLLLAFMFTTAALNALQ